jgi:hypothetical protein
MPHHVADTKLSRRDRAGGMPVTRRNALEKTASEA